jgi:hypothetical protein
VDQLSGGQIIFLAMLGAWLVITVVGMLIGMRKKEHAHRERVAMIERGVAPPPEMYPNKYDAPPWVQGSPAQAPVVRERRAPLPAIVARKLGVLILFGAGGIAWLIALVDDERVALGVGGLLGMIGLAFIVISFNLGLSRDDEDS